VPYGEGKGLIDELFRVGQLRADLRRRLQRYTVGLLPWEFSKARAAVLMPVGKDSEVWVAMQAAYSLEKGLQFSADSEQYII
jgi:hypothetical protein